MVIGNNLKIILFIHGYIFLRWPEERVGGEAGRVAPHRPRRRTLKGMEPTQTTAGKPGSTNTEGGTSEQQIKSDSCSVSVTQIREGTGEKARQLNGTKNTTLHIQEAAL